MKAVVFAGTRSVLLRDMILSGRARPAAIVTHHGSLDDAPALYQAFDQRADGVIKAVLRPCPGPPGPPGPAGERPGHSAAPVRAAFPAGLREPAPGCGW